MMAADFGSDFKHMRSSSGDYEVILFKMPSYFSMTALRFCMFCVAMPIYCSVYLFERGLVVLTWRPSVAGRCFYINAYPDYYAYLRLGRTMVGLACILFAFGYYWRVRVLKAFSAFLWWHIVRNKELFVVAEISAVVFLAFFVVGSPVTAVGNLILTGVLLFPVLAGIDWMTIGLRAGLGRVSRAMTLAFFSVYMVCALISYLNLIVLSNLCPDDPKFDRSTVRFSLFLVMRFTESAYLFTSLRYAWIKLVRRDPCVQYIADVVISDETRGLRGHREEGRLALFLGRRMLALVREGSQQFSRFLVLLRDPPLLLTVPEWWDRAVYMLFVFGATVWGVVSVTDSILFVALLRADFKKLCWEVLPYNTALYVFDYLLLATAVLAALLSIAILKGAGLGAVCVRFLAWWVGKNKVLAVITVLLILLRGLDTGVAVFYGATTTLIQSFVVLPVIDFLILIRPRYRTFPAICNFLYFTLVAVQLSVYLVSVGRSNLCKEREEALLAVAAGSASGGGSLYSFFVRRLATAAQTFYSYRIVVHFVRKTYRNDVPGVSFTMAGRFFDIRAVGEEGEGEGEEEGVGGESEVVQMQVQEITPLPPLVNA
jgi:hypothetical protein